MFREFCRRVANNFIWFNQSFCWCLDYLKPDTKLPHLEGHPVSADDGDAGCVVNESGRHLHPDKGRPDDHHVLPDRSELTSESVINQSALTWRIPVDDVGVSDGPEVGDPCQTLPLDPEPPGHAAGADQQLGELEDAALVIQRRSLLLGVNRGHSRAPINFGLKREKILSPC